MDSKILGYKTTGGEQKRLPGFKSEQVSERSRATEDSSRLVIAREMQVSVQNPEDN